MNNHVQFLLLYYIQDALFPNIDHEIAEPLLTQYYLAYESTFFERLVNHWVTNGYPKVKKEIKVVHVEASSVASTSNSVVSIHTNPIQRNSYDYDHNMYKYRGASLTLLQFHFPWVCRYLMFILSNITFVNYKIIKFMFEFYILKFFTFLIYR